MKPVILIPMFLLMLTITGRAGAQQPESEDRQPPSSPLSPEMMARFGHLLEKDWADRPEWAEMAISILKDDRLGMGNKSGWFGNGSSRYGWDWLKSQFDKDPADNRIEQSELASFISAGDFKKLDRDGSGAITAGDLDWSEGNPILREWSPANDVFFRLDEDSNGRLTMEELKAFFDKAAGEFDFLTPQDLQEALKLSGPPAENRNSKPPAAVRWKMLERLLGGELGDLEPGPAVGQPAPDFELPLMLHDEQNEQLVLAEEFIRLSDYRGKKPVVLIFGSFT